MLSSLEVALLLCARLKQIMSLQLLTDAVLPKKGEKLVHKSKTSKLVISVKCIHRKVFFLIAANSMRHIASTIRLRYGLEMIHYYNVCCVHQVSTQWYFSQ